MDDVGVDLSFDVNLRAVFNWSCAFFRTSRKRGGVIVNIASGLVETGMARKVRENESMREANLADIPMKRFAQPEEITGVCVFLASDVARFMTGQAIAVDGGFTAR